MIRILSFELPGYPKLAVAFSDGARRVYNLETVFALYPAVLQALSSGGLYPQCTLGNRGRWLAWGSEVDLDATNLRYYVNDETVQEWKDTPPETTLIERQAMARTSSRVVIDLDRWVTPTAFAKLAGTTTQNVANRIKRNQIKHYRIIPELGLTLIDVRKELPEGVLPPQG